MTTGKRLYWVVFWVSAGVLAFEIAVMRLLLLASWSHFAFLVISVVLLGFGASGTALALARRWVTRRADAVLFVLAAATALSMPLCAAAAQHCPIEARVVPALLWRSIASWVAYWAILTIPFFLGAGVVGLALMTAGSRIATTYAANLVGGATGALLAPLVMLIVPPAWLAVAMAAPVAAGAAAVWAFRPRVRVAAWAAGLLAVAAILVLDPPRVRMDPYKYAAELERLVAQGAAERVARSYGPRGVVEAYRSPLLHDLPFLSGGEAPPLITAITIDGHSAGSVLEVSSAGDARVMEQTLMAVPYRFAPPRPQVALLGEIGGANAWLAVLMGASRVDVVQPYGAVAQMLTGPLRDRGGAVLTAPGVRWVRAEPRHFIERAQATYDVVQLAALESSAAGSGGMAGLAQNDLVTVTGIERCLAALTPDGVLFVCRGIQEPPRDNVKLLATFAAALRSAGVNEPGRHVVILRDFLAVCTMVKASPWTAAEIERVRAACRERTLTPSWFAGVRDDELNRPDALPAPPDGVGDWYHHAAVRLFSSRAGAFVDGWRFDVRPPTDDRPFFHDFAKLSSIAAQREAFGEVWLTRTESAYLFVVAAAAIVTVLGAALILLPLPFMRDASFRAVRVTALVYFAAIGLGYLLLEMTFLSRLTLLIGDPVVAAAVTIAGFLLASGAGSLTAQRIAASDTLPVTPLFTALVLVGIFSLVALRPLAILGGGLPTAARCLLALAAIAPVGFLMGFPMPLALARFDRVAPAAIPWAWGVNGFASVLASPLAMMIGMSRGFHVAGLAAIAMYAVAGFAFGSKPSLRASPTLPATRP